MVRIIRMITFIRKGRGLGILTFPMRKKYLGRILSLARKAKGTARMPPISVPSTAMATVWNSW